MRAMVHQRLRLYASVTSTHWYLGLSLLVTGIAVSFFGFWMRSAGFSYLLTYLTPALSLLLPIPLLFRGFEKNGPSDAPLLFSLSPNIGKLVFARYWATLILIALPIGALCFIPPLYSLFGEVSFPITYTALLGLFLFLAWLLALEGFLISLPKSPFLRTVAAFLLPVLLYVIRFSLSFLSLPTPWDSLQLLLNPVGMLELFTYGRLPIGGIFYFLISTVLLRLLQVFLLKCRRGDFTRVASRRSSYAIPILGVLLATALNIAVCLLPPTQFNPDISNSQVYTVSGASKDYLHTLSKKATIYYLTEGGLRSVDRDFYAFLQSYTEESNQLSVNVIDLSSNRAFIEQYALSDAESGSLLVVGENRFSLLQSEDLYHYYNSDLQLEFSPAYYNYCIYAYLYYTSEGNLGNFDAAAVQYGAELYQSTATTAYFDGDTKLLNAIRYVTDQSIPSAYLFQTGETRLDGTLQAALQDNGYFFYSVDALNKIPAANCDLLLLCATKDISTQDAKWLSSYLNEGGKVFLLTDADTAKDLTNLQTVTSAYGLHAEPSGNIVATADANVYYSAQNPDLFLSHIAPWNGTQEFDGTFALLRAHAIEIQAIEGVTVTSWLHTGDSGYLLSHDEESNSDTDDELQLQKLVSAVIAERGDSALVWLASVYSASSAGHSMSSGGNYTLLQMLLDSLTENNYLPIEVPSRAIPSQILSPSIEATVLLSLLFIFVVPTVPVVIGSARLHIRKSK